MIINLYLVNCSFNIENQQNDNSSDTEQILTEKDEKFNNKQHEAEYWNDINEFQNINDKENILSIKKIEKKNINNESENNIDNEQILTENDKKYLEDLDKECIDETNNQLQIKPTGICDAISETYYEDQQNDSINNNLENGEFDVYIKIIKFYSNSFFQILYLFCNEGHLQMFIPTLESIEIFINNIDAILSTIKNNTIFEAIKYINNEVYLALKAKIDNKDKENKINEMQQKLTVFQNIEKLIIFLNDSINLQITQLKEVKVTKFDLLNFQKHIGYISNLILNIYEPLIENEKQISSYSDQNFLKDSCDFYCNLESNYEFILQECEKSTEFFKNQQSETDENQYINNIFIYLLTCIKNLIIIHNLSSKYRKSFEEFYKQKTQENTNAIREVNEEKVRLINIYEAYVNKINQSNNTNVNNYQHQISIQKLENDKFLEKQSYEKEIIELKELNKDLNQHYEEIFLLKNSFEKQNLELIKENEQYQFDNNELEKQNKILKEKIIFLENSKNYVQTILKISSAFQINTNKSLEELINVLEEKFNYLKETAFNIFNIFNIPNNLNNINLLLDCIKSLQKENQKNLDNHPKFYQQIINNQQYLLIQKTNDFIQIQNNLNQEIENLNSKIIYLNKKIEELTIESFQKQNQILELQQKKYKNNQSDSLEQSQKTIQNKSGNGLFGSEKDFNKMQFSHYKNSLEFIKNVDNNDLYESNVIMSSIINNFQQQVPETLEQKTSEFQVLPINNLEKTDQIQNSHKNKLLLQLNNSLNNMKIQNPKHNKIIKKNQFQLINNKKKSLIVSQCAQQNQKCQDTNRKRSLSDLDLSQKDLSPKLQKQNLQNTNFIIPFSKINKIANLQQKVSDLQKEIIRYKYQRNILASTTILITLLFSSLYAIKKYKKYKKYKQIKTLN